MRKAFDRISDFRRSGLLRLGYTFTGIGITIAADAFYVEGVNSGVASGFWIFGVAITAMSFVMWVTD